MLEVQSKVAGQRQEWCARVKVQMNMQHALTSMQERIALDATSSFLDTDRSIALTQYGSQSTKQSER